MRKLLYIGALSSLLLVACGDNETPEKETMIMEKAENKTEVTQKRKVVTFTVDEFETAYTDKLTRAFNPLPKVKESDNRYTINLDGEEMVLFLNTTDEKLNKAITASKTVIYKENKDKIRIAFDALVKTTDSSLNDKQIEQLYSDLKITWDDDMLDQEVSQSLNGVTYTYKAVSFSESIVLQAQWN